MIVNIEEKKIVRGKKQSLACVYGQKSIILLGRSYAPLAAHAFNQKNHLVQTVNTANDGLCKYVYR